MLEVPGRRGLGQPLPRMAEPAAQSECLGGETLLRRPGLSPKGDWTSVGKRLERNDHPRKPSCRSEEAPAGEMQVDWQPLCPPHQGRLKEEPQKSHGSSLVPPSPPRVLPRPPPSEVLPSTSRSSPLVLTPKGSGRGSGLLKRSHCPSPGARGRMPSKRVGQTAGGVRHVDARPPPAGQGDKSIVVRWPCLPLPPSLPGSRCSRGQGEETRPASLPVESSRRGVRGQARMGQTSKIAVFSIPHQKPPNPIQRRFAQVATLGLRIPARAKMVSLARLSGQPTEASNGHREGGFPA